MIDELTEEQYVEWIKGQIKNYVDSRGKYDR